MFVTNAMWWKGENRPLRLAKMTIDGTKLFNRYSLLPSNKKPYFRGVP